MNNLKTKKSSFKYTLKFATLFVPSSIKDISLYSRSLLVNDTYPSKKIIVKQSYIFLVWLNYLADFQTKTNDTSVKKPSFFIYPFRNYKTTITKAPMAHKTYSQEQYMLRYYTLSVSFFTNKSKLNSIKTLNDSIYFFLKFNLLFPYIGTNLLILHKYKFSYKSSDKNFFSFFYFHNTNLINRMTRI